MHSNELLPQAQQGGTHKEVLKHDALISVTKAVLFGSGRRAFSMPPVNGYRVEDVASAVALVSMPFHFHSDITININCT